MFMKPWHPQERAEEWGPGEAEGCNYGIERGKLDAPKTSRMVNVADQTGKMRQADSDGVRMVALITRMLWNWLDSIKTRPE